MKTPLLPCWTLALPAERPNCFLTIPARQPRIRQSTGRNRGRFHWRADTVQPADGTELIKVITSTRPISIVPEPQFLPGSGPFRSIDGGVRALTRDLQVVAGGPPPADALIAFNNFALYTVPYRAPPPPPQVVYAPPPPAPAYGQPISSGRRRPSLHGSRRSAVPAAHRGGQGELPDRRKVTDRRDAAARRAISRARIQHAGRHALLSRPGGAQPVDAAQALFVSEVRRRWCLQMAGPPESSKSWRSARRHEPGARRRPAAPPPPAPGAASAAGALPPPPAPGRRSCRASARGAACRPSSFSRGSRRSFLFHVPDGDGQRRLHGYPLIEARALTGRAHRPLAGLSSGDLHASIDRNHRPRLRAFDSDGSRPRPIKRRASGPIHAGPVHVRPLRAVHAGQRRAEQRDPGRHRDGASQARLATHQRRRARRRSNDFAGGARLRVFGAERRRRTPR